MRAQRAVARRERRERLLQQPDAGATDLEPRIEEKAAECGHVSECGLGEKLTVAEPARDRNRLFEDGPRLRPVAGTPLRVAEAQQQLRAPLARRVTDGRDQL